MSNKSKAHTKAKTGKKTGRKTSAKAGRGWLFIGLFVAYLGTSAYLLFATGDSLPQYKKMGFVMQLAAWLKVMPDKVLHTILFIPIVPLAWAAVKPRYAITKILLLWSGLLFGILTEIVQHYLPYRTGDIADLAADVVGSVLGLPFLLIFFISSRKSLKRK
ncbi:MAG: VanZ family protein [Bacteroidales bacterium]|jgi:hypothetical protein